VETLIAIQNLKQGALIHTLGAAAQALLGFLIARIKYPQKIICGLARPHLRVPSQGKEVRNR
jgi:hypothetical protein